MTGPEANVTVEDYCAIDWDTAVGSALPAVCERYSHLLLAAADEAESLGELERTRILRLLGRVCSLHLKSGSPRCPFVPMMRMGDCRSADVGDFIESLDLFAEIVAVAEDSELRARLADVIWVSRSDHVMGVRAVESYLASADRLLGASAWMEFEDRVERALRLAALQGKDQPAFRAASQALQRFLDTIDLAVPGGPSVKLFQLLLEFRIEDPARHAALAGQTARRAANERQWYLSGLLWELSARFCDRAGKSQEARSARIEWAETYVNHAEDCASKGQDTAAADHYELAIQVYRRVGHIQKRIDELHKRLREHQRNDTGGIGEISTEVDLSESARLSAAAVAGLTFSKSLFRLAALTNPPPVTLLRERAEDTLAQSVFLAFLPIRTVSQDGRTLAIHPGLHGASPASREDSVACWMIWHGGLHRQLAVGGVILPALQQIVSEHSVGAEGLEFVIQSPLVPEGHGEFYVRGLLAGFHNDLTTAVHVLIPQVENSIRYALNQMEVVTSGLDQNGVQMEYSLEVLLGMPEVEQWLGADAVFDLKGLLVNQTGPNLRNKVAHGLATFEEVHSVDGLYLWWWALRLCLVLIPVTLTEKGSEDAPDQDDPGSANV